MEWFVMNATTNQVMGKPIGTGCQSTFTGQYEGTLASLRAWPFRIMYSIDSHRIIVEVLDLGHRKDIYK